MADMIDAREAKQRLGCDDAALQNYVNNGSIRAQRSGGKLLLNQEDVDKLVKDKDDEGTIVLTGDSDDLSIDLGKVVDDSAETIVQGRGDKQGTESITFGEDLEVVSFDDNHNTSELVFDETKQTGAAGNLSFTDSNTAVMTAVDETAVGATTAPIDFQTGGDEPAPKSSGSARRSVRSQRVVVDAAPVHWMWPTLMVLTLIVAFIFILPYYVIGMYPGEGKFHNKNRVIGVSDGGWTGMAGGIAGFTVEPSKEVFDKRGGGGDFIPNPDTQGEFRFKRYRGESVGPGTRPETFVITAIDLDKKTATGGRGKTYTLREATTPVTGSETPITEMKVDVWK
ncbi:MAG: helix-turn-helix domain-containing protein [Planctomycetes bacterium]|nr:helix-turn-helix domain-containing protein [Planctomycetota bacterium]